MKLTSDIIRKLIGEELEKSLLTELDETQQGMVDAIVDILRQTYEINPASVTTILSTVKTNLSKPVVKETFVDKRKQSADKHFSGGQSPGDADDTWHNCMVDVKKDGKSLESAAKICTKSREEGGATLKWGEKRKKEVRAARPGGMK